MRSSITMWIEQYLFFPNMFQRMLSLILLPLSALYCLIVIFKRVKSIPKDLGIPVVSIGNLILGGSGKTPFTIALASRYPNSAIVLRGYKRKSKGLKVVSDGVIILEDVKDAGDEAIEYVKSLPSSIVIVSEDRVQGIQKAKKLGAKVVFLDDGFNKSHIKKFDILLSPDKEPTNKFCLPSGGYKNPRCFAKYANLIAKEKIDFKREVNIQNQTDRMSLITAISKPERLNRYLPEDKIITKEYFPDHHFFTKQEIHNLIDKHNPTSILTTNKDLVKLEDFGFDISLLELKIEISQKILSIIDEYIKRNQ